MDYNFLKKTTKTANTFQIEFKLPSLKLHF